MKDFAYIQTDNNEVWLFWGNLKLRENRPSNNTSLYVPYFHHSTEKCWISADHIKKIDLAEFKKFLQDQSPDLTNTITWTEVSFDDFKHDYQTLQCSISDGLFQKGVPVSFQSGHAFQAKQTLLSLLNKNITQIPSNLFLYGLFYKNEGLIGATPEYLLHQTSPRKVISTAVAGTEWEEAHEQSKKNKDRDEHKYVIDYFDQIVSDNDKLIIGDSKLRNFGSLSHLYSVIQIEFHKNKKSLELIENFHPSPALGTYPKNENGMKWLKELRGGKKRRRHGAPFALVHPDGNCFCLVAIRNIQSLDDELQIYAGCGVVKESDYDNERLEILKKIQTVKEQWK